MSDLKRPPPSVGIDNKAPNQGAQGVFNAPVYVDIGSLADRDRIDRDKRHRERMLERVHTFWIKEVLEQSLHGAALIALSLNEQSDLIKNPWRLILQEADQPAHPLPSGTHIVQAYDEVGGELLILGDPGAGKTTLLLELTRDLLDRARHDESHLIPAVFNLSSWAEKRQPLAIWLVEELLTKYVVPRAIGQTWVDNGQILPLLDGLDEVSPAARSACIEAINAYRQAYGMIPLVVCSRSAEYLAQTARLSLQRAVTVQPLTMQQIDEYLQSAGTQLESLRKALHEDPSLQELATTPLMLSVLTLAYHGERVESLQSRNSSMVRRQVFETYVDRMLKRRRRETRYTPQQTKDRLAWLAQQLAHHSQSQFYLERIQPNWLPREQQWQRLYTIGIRLCIGMLFALGGVLVVGVHWGLIASMGGYKPKFIFGAMIIGGLLYGAIFGLTSQVGTEIKPAEVVTWLWAGVWQKLGNVRVFRILRDGFIGCLMMGSLSSLAFAYIQLPFIYGVFFGLLSGIASGLSQEVLEEHMAATPQQAETNTRWRDIIGSAGLIGLLMGLSPGLLIGLRMPLLGLIFAMVFGSLTALIFGSFGKIVSKWPRSTQQKYSVPIGLIIGVFYGLFSGFLRWLLIWQVYGISSFARNVEFGMVYGLFGLIIGMLWSRRQEKCNLSVGLIFGALNGLVFGTIAGLIYGNGRDILAGLIAGVLFGLIGWLMSSLIIGLTSQGAANIKRIWTNIPRWSMQSKLLRNILILSFAYMTYNWWLDGENYGFVGGFFQGLFDGLAFGTVSALGFGVLIALTGGLSSTMMKDQDLNNLIIPNQGIKRSVHNGLFVGLTFLPPTGLICGLMAGLLQWVYTNDLHVGVMQGLGFGMAVAILCSIITGLSYGGLASIQHLVLRTLLWYLKYTPWHYAHFLDYTVERILLHKIGGGYTFIHPLFQDYFTQLDEPTHT